LRKKNREKELTIKKKKTEKEQLEDCSVKIPLIDMF